MMVGFGRVTLGFLCVALSACQTVDTKPHAQAKATGEVSKEVAQPSVERAEPADEQIPEGMSFWAVGPVAYVDGAYVTADEFNAAARRLAKINPAVGENAEAYRDQLIQRLIDDTLVKSGVKARVDDVTADDVEAEYTSFVESVGSQEELERFFQKVSMDEQTLRREMRWSIAVKWLLQDQYGATASDDDVRAYYRENQHQFQQSESLRLRQILLRVPESASPEEESAVEKRAEEIAEEARGGADFAALARDRSEGVVREEGGDLGFVETEKLAPKIYEALKSTTADEVVGPLRTESGYHVLKVVEKRGATVLPLEEVERQIRKELERPLLRDAMSKWMQELKDEADVRRMPANVKMR